MESEQEPFEVVRMELGLVWPVRMELELELVWPVRTELQQESKQAARREWEPEQVEAARRELVQAVQMEWEPEPEWAARTESRQIPCLAALAVPRFPATSPEAQAWAWAWAGHTTPDGRCGESGECPAATARASISSPVGSTQTTEGASAEPRGTETRGAKAWAAKRAGDWATSAERRAKTPRRETFRANPRRS